MDFFGKYKSPLGYYNNANQIDSYGVNHSGFTTRDELEYQFARQQRENELMNQCKAQGITENFPQYGVNFWGNSGNNYGFRTENSDKAGMTGLKEQSDQSDSDSMYPGGVTQYLAANISSFGNSS